MPMEPQPRLPAVLELRDVPASDPWETIRRGSRLLSPKVGLINRLGEGVYQAQDPAYFSAGVRPAEITRYLSGGQSPRAGGGGEEPVAALAATFGELAERYCMCLYDREEMVLGSYSELAPDAVAPDLLRLYSREQVERLGTGGAEYFDESSRIRWVWGYSLTEHRPRLVPAGLVYLNYRAGEDEVNIGRNASSGLASANTLEEAILGGLLEVVERDAFTVSWLHRKLKRRVEIDDPEIQADLDRRLFASHPSVDIQVFDISLDLPIPVLFLLLQRPAEFGPTLCIGASARLSPRRAVRKCMAEAGQAFPYFRFLLETDPHWQPAADLSNLTSFDHHSMFYLKRPDLIPEAFSFCYEEPERVPLSQMPDVSTGRVLGDLNYCIDRLSEQGLEVIVVEITTPDILEVGMRVVRVLVPGLVPLHGNHLRPFLGARRLFEVPHQLGWERSGWSPGQGLNPFPHPFP